MKLKQIISNQSNGKAAPTIAVCLYNGRLYFNSPTVKLLSLQAGDHVAFFQDEDRIKDWYFLKMDMATPGDGSVELKERNQALFTVCGKIARGMLESVNAYETVTFYIEPKPVVIGKLSYWKVLTDKTVK